MKTMKIISLLVCVLAIACLFAGCVDKETPAETPNEMIAADSDTWDKIISETGKPIIALLYFDECPDCQAIKPTYEEMPAKYPNVTFVKLDIKAGENMLIPQKYGTTEVPEFMVFEGGVRVNSAYIDTVEELEQYVGNVANGTIMRVADINTWDKIISQSGKPIIGMLYADWCPDCQAVKPTYEEMPKNYPEITFVKINIDDENKPMRDKYDTKEIPEFILFENGTLITKDNLFTPEELEQFVKDVASGRFK